MFAGLLLYNMNLKQCRWTKPVAMKIQTQVSIALTRRLEYLLKFLHGSISWKNQSCGSFYKSICCLLFGKIVKEN